MRRRIVLAVASVMVPAAAAAWWLFRPETLVLNRRVDERVALSPAGDSGGPASAALLAVGHLHEVRHAASGTVTIHRRADGTMVLRLSELRVDNGPDLYVYLVAAPDALDDITVTRSGFISLGPLKGNLGNHNYEVPPDVDLSKYRAVSIWCRRFGVNFATAPLMTG